MDFFTLGVGAVSSVAVTLITAGGIYGWGWNVLFSDADREEFRNALRTAGAGSIADHI